MKKLLALSLMAFAAVGAFAQGHILNNPNNKAYLGARISVDASIPGDVKYKHGGASVSSDVFGTGGGLSLGAVYNIPIRPIFMWSREWISITTRIRSMSETSSMTTTMPTTSSQTARYASSE